MLEVPESWDTFLGAASMEWNQPKRKKYVSVKKAERKWRSEDGFDFRHGDKLFGVCPAGFQSCFGSVFPQYAPFLCCGMVMYNLCWMYVSWF